MSFRFNRIAYLLILALVVTTVGLMFNSVTDRMTAAETRAERRDVVTQQNQKALTDANAKVTALSDQIRDLGKKPIVSSTPVLVAGLRGPGPTAGQVVVAIQQYCTAHGQCRGPAGPRGGTGDTGKPGVDGVSPPAAKDGADGTNGSNGSDGRNGRGVESTTCNPDGSWTIRYDDGTDQNTDGPCRAPVLP